MHDLQTLLRLNVDTCGYGVEYPPYEFRLHPKICALRKEIDALPVSSEDHRWLRYALWRYSDQLIEREEPQPSDGWSNFEALQQVALGDRFEAAFSRGLQ